MKSAIDWLEANAGVDIKREKTVRIYGKDFTFYHYPLTIAEQKAANKAARSEDPTDAGIELLIKKALDENGQLLFRADAAPRLRNRVERSEVEKILIALIVNDEEENMPELDMKSSDETVKKTK